MALTYDAITIGGGIAGSTLARSLAECGKRVLVVEREREFKDRVRGEQMQPWGIAEAVALGIYDLLRRSCGHEQPWVDMFRGPTQIAHRDLTSTTLQGAPHFNFYHPRMQETLLSAAVEVGADVWRGASIKDVRRGFAPTALVEKQGTTHEVSARLIVGADGKFSSARRWGGFDVKQDRPFLMIAGLLVDDMRVPDHLFSGPDLPWNDEVRGTFLGAAVSAL